MYESVLANKITDFINKNNGLDVNQFGFQSKNGTEPAVLQVVEEINTALDDNLYVGAVFVDLQKAFDTVDHNLLLQFLNQMGLRGHCNRNIKSYLSEREVYTRIDDELSNRLYLKTGVPQGSVLGPLFYILYINNIKEVKLKAKYTIYTDDTCLIYRAKTGQKLEDIMNSDLKEFKNWLDGKTKYMLFNNKDKRSIQTQIKIENDNIERVEYIRYLGVQINDKLSWKQHTGNIMKKIVPGAAVIGRSPVIDQKLSKLIYNAHILSHVRYLCIVWTHASKHNISRVNRLLSRIIMIVYRLDRRTPSDKVFALTSNLELEDIIQVEKSKLMYKILNSEIKSITIIQYNKDVHTYETRAADNIKTQRGRTGRINLGIIKTASQIYNSLPKYIKKARNVRTFTKSHCTYKKCRV